MTKQEVNQLISDAAKEGEAMIMKEEAILPHVDNLLSAARGGDIAAIGAKERVRNHIENEREKFQQFVDTADAEDKRLFEHQWKAAIEDMELSAYVLDGVNPETFHVRGWSLVKLEAVMRDQQLTDEDIYQIITSNIILADAASPLEQWLALKADQEKTQQTQQLIKKLRKEEDAFKRKKARKAAPK